MSVWRALAPWGGFVVVHAWLGLLNLTGPGLPLGDVTYVYSFWMDQALVADFWVGIDSVWVYPVLALVPMLIATLGGTEQYSVTWLVMIVILNAVAFGFLTEWGRSRARLATAWWWLGFLALLGPIALGRLDSVTVPIAIVGVLLISARPRAAAIVLTVATWIKVWPAALLGAAVIALRTRRAIVLTGAVLSAGIVLIALAFGSGGNVFSFVGQQTGRGLQIEAPVSVPWLWQVAAGVPGTAIYYDQEILTFQVLGPGVEAASAVMTPLLAISVAAIALLGVRAVRRGVAGQALLPVLALALTTALIAFNKVGSPQFISWLAVPIVLGLVTSAHGRGRSFRVPAGIVLVIAAVTQVVYPYLYDFLLAANPAMLAALTVRNALLFVLLGWAIRAILTARGSLEATTTISRE